MIHVHNMKIRFPCSDGVWSKDNTISWTMAKAEMPRLPSLLEASRSLISKCEILPGTSNFVAWILLHALISISWALVSCRTIYGCRGAWLTEHVLSVSFGEIWRIFVCFLAYSVVSLDIDSTFQLCRATAEWKNGRAVYNVRLLPIERSNGHNPNLLAQVHFELGRPGFARTLLLDPKWLSRSTSPAFRSVTLALS